MKISEKDFVTLPNDNQYVWQILSIKKNDIQIKLIATLEESLQEYKIFNINAHHVGMGYLKIFIPIDEEIKNKLLKLMVFE